MLDRKEDQHDMVITAEYASPVEFCVRCGIEGPQLKRHGIQIQHFLDTPIHGKRSMIQIRRQRYKCLECGKTFFQPLYFVDDKRQMTRRLLEYIQRRSLDRTFTEVASDVGLDEKTVRNVFFEHVRNLNCGWMPETPVWLGIDELKLAGRQRCMLTNVAVNTMVDLLVDRNKPTVCKWLSKLVEPEKVKVVTMDMWRPYRDAVLEVLPNAICIVDQFHVVRMANDALNTVRKSFREGLDAKGRRKLLRSRYLLLKRRSDLKPDDFAAMQEWTNNVPILFSTYNAKEDFFDLYECETKAKAMEYYDTWKECLRDDRATYAAFSPIIDTVDRWRPEIMNYFDYRVTNAYTESVNGVAKIINRMARGYSFEAIRAKLLFGYAKHVERPKPFSGVIEDYFRSTVDCGVSLPHLVELLSSGHLSTLKSE